jgi:hypothetical protein
LTRSSDSPAATDTTSGEKISEQMTVTWIVVAVVVAAAAAVAGWLISRRGSQQKANPLTKVVADALAAEWASAVSTDTESVRGAVLNGEPARVRARLASLVAEVMVTFEWDGAKTARTVVRCEYATGAAVTTVTLEVPWENVPQDVRADFLRSGDKSRSRRWSFSAP